MSSDRPGPGAPTGEGSAGRPDYSEPATERSFVPMAQRTSRPDGPPLPEPDAVPRLVLEPNELEWVALDPESLRVARLIDGVRSVRELAAICGCELVTAQIIVAGLRDRHVARA